jgi:hypothetical protein
MLTLGDKNKSWLGIGSGAAFFNPTTYYIKGHSLVMIKTCKDALSVEIGSIWRNTQILAPLSGTPTTSHKAGIVCVVASRGLTPDAIRELFGNLLE